MLRHTTKRRFWRCETKEKSNFRMYSLFGDAVCVVVLCVLCVLCVCVCLVCVCMRVCVCVCVCVRVWCVNGVWQKGKLNTHPRFRLVSTRGMLRARAQAIRDERRITRPGGHTRRAHDHSPQGPYVQDAHVCNKHVRTSVRTWDCRLGQDQTRGNNNKTKRVCVCVNVCVVLTLHIQIHAHTHMDTHTHVCVCVCVCVCVSLSLSLSLSLLLSALFITVFFFPPSRFLS